MSVVEHKFSYTELEDSDQLNKEDADLLERARAITAKAYAPYSNFFVGAAALLENNEVVTATNQENASYPVGICAERTLLSTVASLFNDVPVKTIAVSYDNKKSKSDKPVFPCGICRQSLSEYESRFQKPIRLIVSGLSGKVLMLNSVSDLLPLGFSQTDLL